MSLRSLEPELRGVVAVVEKKKDCVWLGREFRMVFKLFIGRGKVVWSRSTVNIRAEGISIDVLYILNGDETRWFDRREADIKVNGVEKMVWNEKIIGLTDKVRSGGSIILHLYEARKSNKEILSSRNFTSHPNYK